MYKNLEDILYTVTTQYKKSEKNNMRKSYTFVIMLIFFKKITMY